MNLILLKLMLAAGILGHALNMYCDRILSIFPNGKLKLENFKDLGDTPKMAYLMEGVSEKIPVDCPVHNHRYCTPCKIRSRRIRFHQTRTRRKGQRSDA